MPQIKHFTWQELISLPLPFEAAQEEALFLTRHSQNFATHRRLSMAMLASGVVAMLCWLQSTNYPAVVQWRSQALSEILLIGTGLLLLLLAWLGARGRFEADENYASALLAGSALGTSALLWQLLRLSAFSQPTYSVIAPLLGLLITATCLRLLAGPLAMLMFGYGVWAVLCAPWGTPLEFSALAIPLAGLGYVLGNLSERLERADFQAQDYDLQQHGERRSQATLPEMERRRDQLALRLLDLDRKGREQTQFLLDALHDLRQPVQAMDHTLEALSHNLKQQDLASALAMQKQLRGATGLLKNQLNSMTELTRLQAGLFHPKIEAFDLGPVVRDVLQQLASQARAAQVSLVLDEPPQANISVRSDVHGLQKILHLLLDNGIKHRDAGKTSPPRVTVRLSIQAADALVEIEDNGVGIAESSLSRGAIFKPFFKGSKTRDEQPPGAGLGLCIVQTMMNLLPDHALQLDSKLGVGTSLRLTLPCAEPELRIPTDASLARPLARDQFAPEQLIGCYVLLVDDEVAEAQTLCQWFSNSGVLCECVASFQELEDCVEKMERLPDVLISSMNLAQGKTVVDVIQLVTQWFDAVPLLLLSSLDIDEQTTAALQCQAVLTRPPTPNQLWSAITQTAAPGKPAVGES